MFDMENSEKNLDACVNAEHTYLEDNEFEENEISSFKEDLEFQNKKGNNFKFKNNVYYFY